MENRARQVISTKPPRTAASDIDTAVGLRVAVARIHRSLRVQADRRLTLSETSALARIDQARSLRLGALAKLEGIAPATMSKVVDSLQVRGFVERVPDALDGRASLIQMSPAGVKFLHRWRTTTTAAIDQALASLSASERVLMRRALPVLEKLSDHLQANAADHLGH